MIFIAIIRRWSPCPKESFCLRLLKHILVQQELFVGRMQMSMRRWILFYAQQISLYSLIAIILHYTSFATFSVAIPLIFLYRITMHVNCTCNEMVFLMQKAFTEVLCRTVEAFLYGSTINNLFLICSAVLVNTIVNIVKLHGHLTMCSVGLPF